MLFLFGSALLLISMQLRCVPLDSDRMDVWRNDASIGKAYESWMHFSILARFPVVFAGVAGIFISFWPGKNPTRRILCLVSLPALGGILALCIRFLSVTNDLAFPFQSVLQRGAHNETWGLHALWTLGPALHMSLLGLGMVLLFLSRLWLGIADLPLSLAEATSAEVANDESTQWSRTKVLMFISIAGTTALSASSYFIVQAVFRPLSPFMSLPISSAVWHISLAIPTALLAGIAAWAAGEKRRSEFKKFIAFPRTPVGLLGIVFAAGAYGVPNLLVYLRDRIHWAIFEFGQFSPPIVASYFRIPDLYFLWYTLGAFFEEIIWRGYLQPRFVRRFGLTRGIFLLGLVWSAFHFFGDFQGAKEDYQVLVTLFSRLGLCLTLSYVFAWLTLKSGSIWPAGIAHGLHNVIAFSSSPSHEYLGLFWARILVIVYYGVLAVMLFKFWPPVVEQDVAAPLPELGTEPAI